MGQRRWRQAKGRGETPASSLRDHHGMAQVVVQIRDGRVETHAPKEFAQILQRVRTRAANLIYDPEVANNNGGSEVIGRVDALGYPNYRTISASLQPIF